MRESAALAKRSCPSACETSSRAMEGLIVGEDPRHPVRLAQKIYRSLIGAGSSGGSIVLALSGVELALWDLHGKMTGLPLWQLLGGKYRDRVRIYADTARPGDRSPEAYADGVRQRVEAGTPSSRSISTTALQESTARTPTTAPCPGLRSST